MKTEREYRAIRKQWIVIRLSWQCLTAVAKFSGFTVGCLLAIVAVGCRGAAEVQSDDFAELVVNGDAVSAARCCGYPLKVNIGPLAPKIRNEAEFVKWFPILFDAKARRDLASEKRKFGGWSDRVAQVESFGRGELWRNKYTKKVTTVNIISEHLFHWWKTEYGNDLLTLAPEYRKGCVWSACYFKSNDGVYFGRVDALGEPWALEGDGGTSAGTRVSDKFRIMLFKRGQRTGEKPWRVFVYDANDDATYGGRHYGNIESEKNKFSFWKSQTTQFPADYGLEYEDGNGRKVTLELNACDWPPDFRID